MIDLHAYLRRIGHAGAPTPTLDTLRALHLAHPQAIPFENLNPLLRWPVQLDAASLQAKLVHGGRGGHCLEHNLLLLHALRAIGFDAHGLAARVLWNEPQDAIHPRTHMLLLVSLDGARWIADVGFGGQTLTAPLPLVADAPRHTPHGMFRLKRLGEDWLLQSLVRDAWKTLYRFDLQPQHLADDEVVNWYLTHHPESHFLCGLICARPAPEGRWALHDTELALHRGDGTTERRTLHGPAELHAALLEVFGIAMKRTPELDAVLVRVSG